MPGPRIGTVILLCAVALSGAGCKRKTVRAAPPPVVSAPSEPSQPAPEETKPETAPEPAAPKPEPAPVKPAPTAPRSGPASTPTPAPPPPPARGEPPQLIPRLTPAEQAEYERKTNEAVAAAEKNMRAADGKRLNALQLDLLEKIRGFLGQAREAMRASDLIRARNLAEKALVLSVELVNSL